MHSGLTPTDVLRYIHRMLGAAMQEIELSDDDGNILYLTYSNGSH